MPQSPPQAPLQDLASRLVEAALKAGAEAADAIVMSGRQLAVNVRDGAVEKTESAENTDLGLRVLIGQKQAMIATSDTSAGSLDTMVERVIKMARLASEDPYAGLAPREMLATSVPDLDLNDTVIRSSAELEADALAAERHMLGVAGVSKSSGAAAGTSNTRFYMVASNGFAGGYARSGYSLSATAIAGEGTGMERDYAHTYRSHFADLESAETIGLRAGQRAVSRLNPHKIETCRLPVIFDERVSPSLVGHFLGAINGSAIARKTSFLKDRMGQRVFAPGVSIIDDPLRIRGLASRPFDDEGIASRTLALAEDGVLATWLLDLATARELGLASTGHGERGIGTRVFPSSSNVTLAAGKRTRAAAIAGIGRGLLVTDLIGHGPNLVTGDYSRGCSGFMIENGEIAYPVAEITIAGHLGEMFAALEPLDDLDVRRNVDAPSVLVGEMTIAGR